MDTRQRKDGVAGHDMTAMRGPPTFDNDAALGVHQGEKLEKRVGHVAGLRVVAPRRVWVLMTKAGPFGVEQAGVEAEKGAVPQVVSSGLGRAQVRGKAGQLGAAFGEFLVGFDYASLRIGSDGSVLTAVTSPPSGFPPSPIPPGPASVLSIRWNHGPRSLAPSLLGFLKSPSIKPVHLLALGLLSPHHHSAPGPLN